MKIRAALVAAAVGVATPLAVATPAHAGYAQGLSCGMAKGVLTGGPASLTGELAVTVEYWCTVRVYTPTGWHWVASEHFSTPGNVAYLPPTPVSFSANPATDRVEVCTGIDWYFGFPGGGTLGFGCRQARYTASFGWVLVPDVLV